MTDWPVIVPGFPAWRRQEDRKTRANEFTHSGIGRSTVLFAVAGKFAVVRRLHPLADMDSVIRIDTHPRGMGGGDRRDHGNREYGKHGDEAREHATKIGIAHRIVH